MTSAVERASLTGRLTLVAYQFAFQHETVPETDARSDMSAMRALETASARPGRRNAPVGGPRRPTMFTEARRRSS
jgi:hypothetical protein